VTPLRLAFMQQALVACTLICAVAPLVGSFVVQRRQSLLGDGIGHVAFAGVGLAFLLGVDPLVGALALTVIAAFALHRLQRAGLGGDQALALIFYGGIALGFLLASRSGGGVNSVLAFLFGSPLNLTWAQVGAVAAIAAVVAVAVVALYGPLLAMAFDEAAARVAGLPVSGLALTLTVVVALLIVGGMYAIGLLLISAMMVVPVAAAARLARSYRGTLVLSSSIGAASAIAGLLVAFYADHTPGAAIVLTAIGCYVVAGWLRPALGRAHRGTHGGTHGGTG
jgi:zinc transport system permease protein